MTGRIIDSKENGTTIVNPTQVKALKAIIEDKGNNTRPFLQYIHYNSEKRRIEATNGRAAIVIEYPTIPDFFEEEEREGFFKISGDSIIEKEKPYNSYPNFDRILPASMENKMYIHGMDKMKAAERLCRISLLTGRYFNIADKGILSIFDFCNWETIEYNNNPGGPIKLHATYFVKEITALIMPMATIRTKYFLTEEEEEEKNKKYEEEERKRGEIVERKAV